MTFEEFAEYKIDLCDIDGSKITEFLNRDSIICEKKGKKGKIKEVDIIPAK